MIPKSKLEEMAWWEKDAKKDHINSATAVSSKSAASPFVKLQNLPDRDDVENKVILDIGCGYGRTLIPMAKCKPKTAYGLDISTEMLRYCAKYAEQNKVNLKLINSALPELPFKAKSIDLIFSSSVLLHLPKTDIPLLLAEVRRVLKLYGKAIFISSFPNALSFNGASNWFPSLLKSKLLMKPIVPGMPKHYTFWELTKILDASGLTYNISFDDYQIVPTSLNRVPLPGKIPLTKLNQFFEKKMKDKGFSLIDHFLPRFFDVTLFS